MANEKIIAVRLDDKGSFNNLLITSNNIQKSLKTLEDRQRRLNLELADVGEGSAEYNQLLSSIRSTEQAINELNGELSLQSAGFGRLSGEISETETTLDRLIDSYNDLTMAGETVDSLNQKHRLLSSSLEEVEGDAQAFEVLSTEARDFENRLNKLNTVINRSEAELEDYTRAADGFGKITSASLTAVTIAAQKLGGGSEEIEKYTQSLVETIAITTAIKDATEAFSAANIQSYKALIQSALGVRIFGASVKSLLGPVSLAIAGLTLVAFAAEKLFGGVTKLTSAFNSLFDSLKDQSKLELENLNAQVDVLENRLGLEKAYLELKRQIGIDDATTLSNLEEQIVITEDLIRARQELANIRKRELQDELLSGRRGNIGSTITNLVNVGSKEAIEGATELTKLTNDIVTAELANVEAKRQVALFNKNNIDQQIAILQFEKEKQKLAEKNELAVERELDREIELNEKKLEALKIAEAELSLENVSGSTLEEQRQTELKIAQLRKDRYDLELSRQRRLISEFKERADFEERINDLLTERLSLNAQGVELENEARLNRLLLDREENLERILKIQEDNIRLDNERKRIAREIAEQEANPTPGGVVRVVNGVQETITDTTIQELNADLEKVNDLIRINNAEVESLASTYDAVTDSIDNSVRAYNELGAKIKDNGDRIRKDIAETEKALKTGIDPATFLPLLPERVTELTEKLAGLRNSLKQNGIDITNNNKSLTTSIDSVIAKATEAAAVLRSYAGSLDDVSGDAERERRETGFEDSAKLLSDQLKAIQDERARVETEFRQNEATRLAAIEDLTRRIEEEEALNPGSILAQNLKTSRDILQKGLNDLRNQYDQTFDNLYGEELDAKAKFAADTVAQSNERMAKSLKYLEDNYERTGFAIRDNNSLIRHNIKLMQDTQDEIDRLNDLLESGFNIDGSKQTAEQVEILKKQIDDLIKKIKQLGGEVKDLEKSNQDGLTQFAVSVAQSVGTVVGDVFQLVANANERALNSVNEQVDAVQQRIEELQSSIDDSFAEQRSLEDQVRNAREEDYKRLLEQIDGERARRKRLQEEKRAQFIEEQKLIRQREALERKARNIAKQAAIAQAVVNGAVAVTNVLASPAASLFPGAGAILAGLVAAQVATQIAVIESQQFRKGGQVDERMAFGGLIQGASHGNGGIRVPELEGKEFVVNKMATAPNLPLLNKVNQTQYREGTQATNTAPSQVSLLSGEDRELLIGALNRPVYVAVKDIREGDARFADVVDNSLL